MGNNRNSASGIARGLVLVLIGSLLIALGFSWGGRWSGFSFNFSELHDGETIEDIEDDLSGDEWTDTEDWSIEDLEEGPASSLSERANDRGESSSSTESRSGVLTDDLETVDIDLKFASLSIRSGTESGYRINGFSRGVLSVSASNRSFTIRERDWGARRLFGSTGYRPMVELVIPKGTRLDKISVSVGAGTVSLRDVVCDEFILENGAGAVTGSGIAAAKAKLESGAGKLEFTDSEFTDARMSSGAGHIGFAGTLRGASFVETGVGSIYLDLAGSAQEYRIRYERGLGSVKIGGESFNGTGSGTSGPAGASSVIDVTTGIGEVRIDFGSGAHF